MKKYMIAATGALALVIALSADATAQRRASGGVINPQTGCYVGWDARECARIKARNRVRALRTKQRR